MNSHDNSQKTEKKQYAPVKPFAFDAWEIWNSLTTAAQLLWEEYETDFIEFCCRNTPVKKKLTTEDHVPF